MNILNWLKSHLLLLIIAFSLVMAIIFLDLLKADYTKLIKADNTLLTETVAPASIIEETPTMINPDPAVLVEKIEIDDRKYNGSNLPKLADETADTIILPPEESKKDQKQDSSEQNTNIDSIFPPENYEPEVGLALPAESQASHAIITPEPGIETTSGTTQVDIYQSELEAARRLYWDGKVGQAQAAYEKLMFEFQKRPEAAAELGNLLLQQGNKKGASWAYKNAIPRYLNLHREQEAISIIQIVSQYDPAIAEQLQKKYW